MPLFVYCNGVISVKRCSVVRKVTDFLSCSFFNDRTTSIAFMQFQKYFFLDLFSLISISSSQKQNKHYILGKNVYVDLIFSFCNIFVAWSFLGRIRFLILKTAIYFMSASLHGCMYNAYVYLPTILPAYCMPICVSACLGLKK